MNINIKVGITKRMDDILIELVKQGIFASKSEAVRSAIRTAYGEVANLIK